MPRKQISSGTTTKFLDDINYNFTEIYTLLENMPNITYGTQEPSDSEGEEGDIYIQYEE